jgi:hypothetical protein
MHSPTPSRGTSRTRRTLQFITIAACATILPAAMSITLAKNQPSLQPQDKPKKPSELRWNPPQVDAPLPDLSATPPCPLSDVLKLAAHRTAELIDHLQNFDAHELVRYEETDGLGISTMAISEKFDYVVDFGPQSGPLRVQENRIPLAGSDDAHISAIVDKGLPVLALIFYPGLEGDYEMHCEGFTQWNSQPAWVVYFRQASGIRPRTLSMTTATSSFPVSLKGRAWIAPDSGQIMHLETNLVKESPSSNYAPTPFPLITRPWPFRHAISIFGCPNPPSPTPITASATPSSNTPSRTSSSSPSKPNK